MSIVNRFFSIIFLLVVLVASLSVNSCTTPPPSNAHDVCSIFVQYPQWYKDARDARHKWGVPISVQMAIIFQESSYRSDAKPGRTKLLFIIPWKRRSTASGYSQATNQTWKNYQRSTNNPGSRDDFGDATDFIGWYAQQAKKYAAISPNNAYRLYLAYHEGINNYKRGSYKNKPWLIKTAKKVQLRANQYRAQLLRCESSLKVPSSWWKLW